MTFLQVQFDEAWTVASFIVFCVLLLFTLWRTCDQCKHALRDVR